MASRTFFNPPRPGDGAEITRLEELTIFHFALGGAGASAVLVPPCSCKKSQEELGDSGPAGKPTNTMLVLSGGTA
jgi:hypothetical protein